MQKLSISNQPIPSADQANIQENMSYDQPSAHPVHNTQTTEGLSMKKTIKKILPVILLAVVAGVGTGFGAHQLIGASDGSGIPKDGQLERVPTGTISNGDVFGSADTESFKDSASGYLEQGGLNGEGSHSLLRPGGEAQTVYLTSSVTDLDAVVGMEVQVWGETFAGQQAGWLMDVGRVEVVDTKATAPVME